MRHSQLSLLVSCFLLTACDQPAEAVQASASPASQASVAAAASSGGASKSTGATLGNNVFADRTGELVNPDDQTMVFLYYDLAGLQPPIERWVESDFRVTAAPAIEKAERRAALTAEMEAGMAAVQGMGLIRLTLNDAKLSEYDPSYSEFTVRALAPSSQVQFAEFQNKVQLKFANGKEAQIWQVPAAEAQGMRDRIGRYQRVELDTLLKVVAVQPGANGGTISVQILEYELRESKGGTTLARIQLEP